MRPQKFLVVAAVAASVAANVYLALQLKPAWFGASLVLLVDTNVLIDLVQDDAEWVSWSEAKLFEAQQADPEHSDPERSGAPPRVSTGVVMPTMPALRVARL